MTAETAKAKNLTLKKLSGTKFRQMLRAGEVSHSPVHHFSV